MLGPQQRICGSISMNLFHVKPSGTYAGNYDGQIIPLFILLALPFSFCYAIRKRRRPTQKPALDIHLDNNLNVTARVGRMSKGTDAPMTAPLRLCSSSSGGRAGSSDMFSSSQQKKGGAGERKSSQVKTAVGDRRGWQRQTVPSCLEGYEREEKKKKRREE